MPQDLLIADDFDLLIEDGDLIVGESTRQHQSLLLMIDKGTLREFPRIGVGALTWINDDVSGDLNSQIKREFEADGMKVLGVRGGFSNLQIEAVYED